VRAHSNGGCHELDRCFAGANSLAPDLMSAEQRLTEIGTILAAGLLRLRRKQSERHGSHLEKNSLDFSPERSVHATARQRREVRR
jgi:hypothetical protein